MNTTQADRDLNKRYGDREPCYEVILSTVKSVRTFGKAGIVLFDCERGNGHDEE
jgi:hypothetical protein